VDRDRTADQHGSTEPVVAFVDRLDRLGFGKQLGVGSDWLVVSPRKKQMGVWNRPVGDQQKPPTDEKAAADRAQRAEFEPRHEQREHRRADHDSCRQSERAVVGPVAHLSSDQNRQRAEPRGRSGQQRDQRDLEDSDHTQCRHDQFIKWFGGGTVVDL